MMMYSFFPDDDEEFEDEDFFDKDFENALEEIFAEKEPIDDSDDMPDTQTILNHIEDGICSKKEIDLLIEDDDLREEFL